MKILVLDNYDSFTYNLVHSLKKTPNIQVYVFRNDEIDLDRVSEFDKILLSPGPGIPSEANLLMPIIEKYAPTKPIFGVCLGQQAIGEVFGATLLNTQKVYHGVASQAQVVVNDEILFQNMPNAIEVGRYHSWVVDTQQFPKDVLEITATGPQGEIMALRHKTYDVRGVQFHPESVLTPLGDQMIAQWVNAPIG